MTISTKNYNKQKAIWLIFPFFPVPSSQDIIFFVVVVSLARFFYKISLAEIYFCRKQPWGNLNFFVMFTVYKNVSINKKSMSGERVVFFFSELSSTHATINKWTSSPQLSKIFTFYVCVCLKTVRWPLVTAYLTVWTVYLWHTEWKIFQCLSVIWSVDRIACPLIILSSHLNKHFGNTTQAFSDSD